MTVPEYAARTKYDRRVAKRYRRDAEGRRGRENRVLLDLLRGLSPVESLLDAPCGVGRVAALSELQGIPYTGLDLAPAMLERAVDRCRDEKRTVAWIRGDLESLPVKGRAFDVVLCLRLLHHLPEPTRSRVVQEAARAASRAVVFTYFHPFALHYAQRRLKTFLTGRVSHRYSHTSGWIDRCLRDEGWRLAAERGTGFLRETRYALFLRDDRDG
ncbi:MAG TPA: class I SAM-dependent methyltransferase [Planctomycetes bacterium]|nr:class I SAM-dependent methyltransferase [Planctomycetota bacterium]